MNGPPSPGTCAAVIVAGGSGTRAGLGKPKQYAPYRGTTVLGFAVRKMQQAIEGVIAVVVPPGDEEAAREAIGPSSNVIFTSGGATRQASVRAGLHALATQAPPETVFIHDAARPDLPGDVAMSLLKALSDHPGAIPVLPVADSVVRADGATMGDPVSRDSLRLVQTPQAFRFEAIMAAHRDWPGAPDAGDDATVLRAAGGTIALVVGDMRLRKLTYAEDFAMTPANVRIGSGYDVHRLVPGNGVWLCGVKIPHDRALSGHSDADVALHALTDAVLGAIGAGDIGEHFPPCDERWRGAASDRFLTHALELAQQRGFRLGNADITIVCEAPKVGPHRDAMRARLARIAGVDIMDLSVKATTTERLGFPGREEGIAAQAVVTMIPQD